jgi:xanthine dehydrogenase accessory factor
VAKFFLRLKAAGLPQELFRKVSAPIGLDIGAETPAEIAVSVVAEIVRVRRRQDQPVKAMSEYPVAARGGDGVAKPPAFP